MSTLEQTDLDILFRPLTIKSLELKNRFVMAPMTRSFSPEGTPGENVAAYYRRRAENEIGLILSEGTVIDRPASRNDPGIPFFHGDALTGWKRVIEEVHDAGGKMAPQIWHVGAVVSRGSTWEPDGPVDSPSGLIAPGQPRGESMTEEAIADTIAAYARAAADAKSLGFDSLEIHGAHGYLIDEFFWNGTNLRDDRYGGATIEERSRFAVEVVAAMRAAVDPDFPIFLRLSQWKQQDYGVKLAHTPEEMERWLLPLRDAGVDVFHCSQRRFWEPEFEGSDLNFAGWAKKLTGAYTVSVGSVGLSTDMVGSFSGESANAVGLGDLTRRMEREEFDLIAVGRAILNDPQWVKKLHTGQTDSFVGFNPASLAELI